MPPPGLATATRHASGRPLVRVQTVARQRLLDRLETGRALGVINVSAAAGWGKTTLLASWLDRIDADVAHAWLTIQASHNDPSVLADDLCRALAGAGPSLPGLAGQDTLGEILTKATGPGGHPVVLVLDDAHLLRETSAIHALAAAAVGMPDGLCLVLSGRSDLPLPWGVLRARRRIVEIREKDLAFDDAETELLLSSILGASAEDPRLSGAVEAAEGWAAGLVMAALAGADTAENRRDVLTSAEHGRYVDQLIHDAVLSTCPAEIREFMLSTALLPVLEPDICAALTGRPDALAVLRDLVVHHRLTVELAADPPTFRYHQLLRRTLQRTLDEERPGQRADLARRAAQLLVERDRVIEATDLVADAGDEELLTTFVRGACGPALRRGYAATVVRWLTTLSDETLDANPELLLALGRASGRRGDLVTAEAAVEQACRSIEVDGVPTDPGLRTALSFFRDVSLPGWHGKLTGLIPALRELETSTSTYGDDATLALLGLPREVITAILAHALLFNGDLDECLEVTRRAATLADVRSLAPNTVLSVGIRALALAWSDREREAADTVRRWLPLIDGWRGSTNDSLLFWCAAAWSGPEDQSAASLQRARRRATMASIPLDRCLPDVAEIRLLTRLGRFERLDAAVSRAREAVAQLPEPGILSGLVDDLEKQAHHQAGVRPDLTEREREVVRALAAGLSRRQIAQELHYSVDTVRTYLRSAYRKLGAADRTSALDRAGKWGLLPPP